MLLINLEEQAKAFQNLKCKVGENGHRCLYPGPILEPQCTGNCVSTSCLLLFPKDSEAS